MALRNALTRASGPLRAFAAGSPAGGLIGLETGASGAFARLARRGAHGRNLVEDELYDRSRQEITLGNRTPSVAADAWIAPNATLVGDADVADQCSVWHGSVLKGDLGAVRLGAFSNVQEKCVIDAAGYAPLPLPRAFSSRRARAVPSRGRTPPRSRPPRPRPRPPQQSKTPDESGEHPRPHSCVLTQLPFHLSAGAFRFPLSLVARSRLPPFPPSFAPHSSCSPLRAATRIGQYVTVGAGTSISSAIVEDNVLIGARCVLGAGSYVEENAALEAGSVVEPGQLIPSGQLWGGNPARYVRDLDGNEINEIQVIARNVYGVSADHADQTTPWGMAYVQTEALRKALGKE